MTTDTTATPSAGPGLDVRALFERYAATFATRDAEAVAALHAEATEFRLRLGTPPARGRAAVAEAFAGFFAQWPHLGFDVHRLVVGADHWVLDWALIARVDGTPVRFDCMDLVMLSPEGLVARKDTFIDASQLPPALLAARTEAAA